MRVVADANVVVSAALARSPQAPSALTLDAAVEGRLELMVSPQLLREIAMVLARPRLRKYVSIRGGPSVRHRPGRPSDPGGRSAWPSPGGVPRSRRRLSRRARDSQRRRRDRHRRSRLARGRSGGSSRARSSRRVSSSIGSADPAASLVFFLFRTGPCGPPPLASKRR